MDVFAGEEIVNFADNNLPDTKSCNNYFVSSFDVQIQDKHNRPEPKELEPESSLEQCNSNTNHASIDACKGCSEGCQRRNTDIIPLKLSQKNADGCTCEKQVCQEPTECLMVIPKYTYRQSEKNILYCLKERQDDDLEFKANIDEQKLKTKTGIAEETNEKTEIGESSKTKTFLLEPNISEFTQSEKSTSMESTTKTHMSGENNKKLV